LDGLREFGHDSAVHKVAFVGGADIGDEPNDGEHGDIEDDAFGF
jgi:hypothetical protein